MNKTTTFKLIQTLIILCKCQIKILMSNNITKLIKEMMILQLHMIDGTRITILKMTFKVMINKIPKNPKINNKRRRVVMLRHGLTTLLGSFGKQLSIFHFGPKQDLFLLLIWNLQKIISNFYTNNYKLK